MSEKYSIPMTWAICGLTAEEDPESYRAILRSKQPQEIGVHTYSHADVSSCTDEELAVEIQKCLNVPRPSRASQDFRVSMEQGGSLRNARKDGLSCVTATRRDGSDLQRKILGSET